MRLRRKDATWLLLLLVLAGGAAGAVGAEWLTAFLVGQDPDDIGSWFERGEHGLLRIRFALAFALAVGVVVLGALLSCGFRVGRLLGRRVVLLLFVGTVAGYAAALYLKAETRRLPTRWAVVRSRMVPFGPLPLRAVVLFRATLVPLFGGAAALVGGLVLWPFSRRRRVRTGARFESRRAVRVRVVGFSDPFDEGVEATLPAGEIVRVHCKAPKGFDGYWLVPERRECLEDRPVPRHVRPRPDDEGYALFVSCEDLARRFRPFDPIRERPTVRAPGRERRE